MTMVQASFVVSALTAPRSAEPEMLLGFTLPALPTRDTIGADATLRIIGALRTSSVTVADLRFVVTAAPDVTIYLLCRIRRPQRVEKRRFHDYAVAVAVNLQRACKDCGYHLQPISDELVFARALMPFQLQAMAEVRREEGLLLLQDAFTEYEVYTTYPWEWESRTHLPLYEVVSQQRGECLASIHLEHTELTGPEQALLSHATSGHIMDLLYNQSARARIMAETFQKFAQHLHQPYLMRTTLAAPTEQTVVRMGQSVLQQVQVSGKMPILQFAQSGYELQAADRHLRYLEWAAWGNLRDGIADTERLRYLVDSQGAAQSFRFPVAPPPITSATQKIKVLLVFADPINAASLRPGTEDRTIREALERARYRDRIATTVRHAATIHDLSRALLEDEFHIVHIAGHGSNDGIVLETQAGKGQIVPPQALAERFADYYKEHRTLRCIMLNACDTIALGQLIVRGVPFAIAMEGELGNQAATEFSRGFYDALGAGKEIDFAFQEGRHRARLAAPASSFVPHLFRKR